LEFICSAVGLLINLDEFIMPWLLLNEFNIHIYNLATIEMDSFDFCIAIDSCCDICDQYLRVTCRILLGGTLLKHAEPNPNDDNSAVIFYFQDPSRDLKSNVLLELMAEAIEQPFYDSLRTKQQVRILSIALESGSIRFTIRLICCII
jgi:hypothetical protein